MTAASPRQRRADDLDDYDIAELRDIFGSPSPPPETSETTTKKRKEQHGGDLGLEGEVSVAKRARVPRVKLDEERLLSEQGIPKLRSRAKGLRFKGKGHEFSDIARLLSFYQLWLDDLFPKAKFLDALAMVEKTGRKSMMLGHRKDWIADARRKESQNGADEEDLVVEPEHYQGDQIRQPSGAVAGTQRESDARIRHDTPRGTARPAEHDDLYEATPLRKRPAPGQADPASLTDDEHDDLEALMEELENGHTAHTPPAISEAEPPQNSRPEPEPEPEPAPDDVDFADEEAAMAEMDGLW